MSFVSPEFGLLALLFFPLFWVLRAHPLIQKRLLLVSSLLLYASWTPAFVWVLLGFAVLIWFLGRELQKSTRVSSDQALKRLQLFVAILLCVSLLLFFKYYEFVREASSTALSALGLSIALPALDVIAPMGVSFFTFQAITYLVAIVKEEHSAQSLEDVCLYLAFWPTIFAGPIIRSAQFFSQVKARMHSGFAALESGKAIYLIMLGLWQKLVFASWLASTFVDPVFKQPEDYNALATLCAMVGYSFQIFMDFAGYTSIVTGLALLLGFNLPQNFAQPYLATNLQQFWLKWHMSLSSFIRDYIYIPLGGNRHGFTRTQCHLVLAMVASGIWHGAAWTFIVWGALHGIAVIWLNVAKRYGLTGRLPAWAGLFATFAFVTLAWVFFRAHSLSQAFAVLAQLGTTAGIGLDSMHVARLLVFGAAFMYLSRYAQSLEVSVVGWINTTRTSVLLLVLVGVFYLLMRLCPSGVPGFIYYNF